MTWQLRKAEPRDKEGIENLFLMMLRSVYKKEDVQGYEPGYLDKFFKDDRSWIYVAESEGNLVGYLSIEQHPDFLYLDDLCIDEKYRGLGIGTEFLKTAQKDASEKNIPQIRLHVEKSNQGAMKLYQRLGYTVAGEKDSRYLMTKIILNKNLCRIVNETKQNQ